MEGERTGWERGREGNGGSSRSGVGRDRRNGKKAMRLNGNL